MQLNDRTREILAFIESFSRERGLPPTIREIGTKFHIASTNGVRYHLNVLEKSGYLRRSAKISRGIESLRVVAVPRKGIPILGRVAAGAPIHAEEHYEGRLETDSLFGPTQDLFALRVRGDSMIDAGIHENDYVVVRQQDDAASGEMIVALIEDDATVKYYKPRGNVIELIPANPSHQPIVVERTADFRIAGVVKGVVRVVH